MNDLLVIYAAPAYGAGGHRSGSASIRLLHLPGTEREATAIRDIGRHHGRKVKVLTGRQATEQQLYAETAPGILHLATHGVLLDDEAPGSVLSRLAAYPMYRGFLAFAGAQTTLDAWAANEARPSRSDGILTAEEAATLDLHGTWLTVLAACDTGGGEARAGEGVLGLRRGFTLAGTQHLLMTLWPIADEATPELMKKFYGELLETGDAPGALAAVQRSELEELRKQDLSRAVHLAGGFVMSSRGSSQAP